MSIGGNNNKRLCIIDRKAAVVYAQNAISKSCKHDESMLHITRLENVVFPALIRRKIQKTDASEYDSKLQALDEAVELIETMPKQNRESRRRLELAALKLRDAWNNHKL